MNTKKATMLPTAALFSMLAMFVVVSPAFVVGPADSTPLQGNSHVVDVAFKGINGPADNGVL